MGWRAGDPAYRSTSSSRHGAIGWASLKKVSSGQFNRFDARSLEPRKLRRIQIRRDNYLDHGFASSCLEELKHELDVLLVGILLQRLVQDYKARMCSISYTGCLCQSQYICCDEPCMVACRA